jgi:hypothetical protein
LGDDATCAELHAISPNDAPGTPASSEVRCLANPGCCYEANGDICKECSDGASGFDGLYFEMYSTVKDMRAVCGKPATYNYTIPWRNNLTNASSLEYIVPYQPDLKYLAGPKYNLLEWATPKGELEENCMDRAHFVTESGTYCPYNNLDEKNLPSLVAQLQRPEPGSCTDLSPEQLADLVPPAPAATCALIMEMLDHCTDDLGKVMQDSNYDGLTSCFICCESCSALNQRCDAPPTQSPYYYYYCAPYVGVCDDPADTRPECFKNCDKLLEDPFVVRDIGDTCDDLEGFFNAPYLCNGCSCGGEGRNYYYYYYYEEGCEPCDGPDGCGRIFDEGMCVSSGCTWYGFEAGPGCFRRKLSNAGERKIEGKDEKEKTFVKSRRWMKRTTTSAPFGLANAKTKGTQTSVEASMTTFHVLQPYGAGNGGRRTQGYYYYGGYYYGRAIPGCGTPPLVGKTGCDPDCGGLAFVQEAGVCAGCMQGTMTRITPDNVGSLTPPAVMCGFNYYYGAYYGGYYGGYYYGYYYSTAELKERFHQNLCSFKCIEGQSGPFTVKGYCNGAENLVDDSNALCLPRSECEALCSELGPACSSIDMSSIAPRCWLNGPYCGYEYRARESFKNLDFLSKSESRMKSYKYEAAMCVDPLAAFDTMEVNNKTIVLDFLFELEATSTQECEHACTGEEGCAGFEIKYNASADTHKCYYFNATGACGLNNTVGPCHECSYRAPSKEVNIGLEAHPTPCHIELSGEQSTRFDRVPGVYISKDHTMRLVFVDASGFDSSKCDGWHVQANLRSPRTRPFGVCQQAPKPVTDHIGLNCTAIKPWECSWFGALCVEQCVPMQTMTDTAGNTIVARYYNNSCSEILEQEPARAYRKSIFRNETGGRVFDNHTSGCVDLDPTTCDAVLAYLCREVCGFFMPFPEEAFGPEILGTVLDYDHDDFASKFVTYSPLAPSNQTKGSFDPHPEWKFVRDDLSELLEHLPGGTPCLRLETGYPIVNGSYTHPLVIETDLMHHLGTVWYAEPPEEEMDWSGHCLQQPTCPTKSTCVVRGHQLTKELGLLDERSVSMEERTKEQRVAALQSEEWDDRKADRQHDPKYGLGLPKILVNEEMTVAALRIELEYERAWGFNTDLFLSVPGHTRFRVAQVPKETETVLAVVLPGAETAVKKHVFPPPGYAPFVSDFLKVSVFDKASDPIPGEVKVELYVPGNLSEFGIKIFHVETKRLLLPEQMPGAYPGWFSVTGPPGHFVATHDLDECASGASGCEAPADGGYCMNTESDYLCGCREGFRALDGSTFPVPVGVQCFRIAPSMDGAFSYLIYPLDVGGEGWKVKEFTAFPAYSVKTGKCAATYFGNPEDDDASPVSFEKIEASAAFPSHEASYLTDGTPEEWWSQCSECLRTENAGAYILGTTAQQVECVRIQMSSDCKVPKFLVARGALPGIAAGKSSADGHAGWTMTQLIDTEGRSTIDIPMPCGDVDMQYFGETLVEYKGVVGACQCLQLCADHIDEACEAWKWYRETRHCFLLKSIFPPDERFFLLLTTGEERLLPVGD